MNKAFYALCLTFSLLSILGVSPAATAQEAAHDASVISPAEFVRRAALSDMYETQSSELAAVKGDAPTRALAAMLNADHQKTSSQLSVIVKGHAQDLPLPPRLDPAHQKLIDELKNLEGPAFSKRFLQQQRQVHQEAVLLFESYQATGTSAELRQWAAQTLPKLKEHLTHVESLIAPAG